MDCQKPSTLPDWWGRLLQDLHTRRPYTWHILTTHVEPSYKEGTLTLTFRTWVEATMWPLRWHDQALGQVIQEHGFPIRDVRLAWRSTAIPAGWPDDMTPVLEALTVMHARACWQHGIDSPKVNQLRNTYADAVLEERKRRRQTRTPINH